MTFERLRAKSGDDRHTSVFLPEHLADAFSAAQLLLDATTEEQLHALGLPIDPYGSRLRRIVSVATLVHDLGKANDHFQEMICGIRDVRQNPQGLRHEWVTLLMLQQLREWVLPALNGSLVDLAIVEWAVVGHHPAPEAQRDHPPRKCPEGAGAEIALLMGHDDYRTALVHAQRLLGLASSPACVTLRRDLVGSQTVFDEIARWHRMAQVEWAKMKSANDRRLVAAVKNCLIAADVAGSALPKALPDDPHRWQWISQSLAAKPEPGDLAAIAQYRLRGGEPRGFQRAVAASDGPVTLVKAGCGSGKTVAAYLWAGVKHPTRRLYFCYPTTGTATEGFRDYLYAPEAEVQSDDSGPLTQRVRELGAKLFHSRREIDFEIILSAGNDTGNASEDAAVRLESLEAWATPVVACTVDTVLGLVQNNRRGTYAWPALSQSAFVFDEIHAYDDRLFGALLRFLRDLPGLPVLLMTASLPADRELALRTLLENRGQSWEPISGPEELETRPRYRKEPIVDNDPLPIIRETLAAGGKVLWVCNTIGRVMEAASHADDLSPLLYHSRFKYEDRVVRHQAVVQAFRKKGPVLAICSQVAEMSLDLSADLLVTDLAPVPAMIQRLGRLNRRAQKGDATKPFVVVDSLSAAPYIDRNSVPDPPDWLNGTRGWLNQLADDKISQRDLATAWEQSDREELLPGGSVWLDGGPRTIILELRDSSPGMTVLMEEDVARVQSSPKALLRVVLPMPPPPISLPWRQWQRLRGLPIAPAGSILYDSSRGAEWQRS
jgi:CRISPR-associated endonuclease/helicase Cas3